MLVHRTHRDALKFLVLALGLAGACPPARATMAPRSGVLPAEVAQALRDGLLALPERPHGLGTSAAPPVWRIPVILVSYSDSALRYRAADFERLLFDTTLANPSGSMVDYYRWVSGGRLRVQGQVVATLVLPNGRDYYGGYAWGLSSIATPNNDLGLVRDALRICQAGVDWSEFDEDRDGFVDMLWVVHAGVGGEGSSDRNDLWSITSRMAGSWRTGNAFTTDDPIPGSATRYMSIDRFTILPELSVFHRGALSEIGVFCHEFGHALGLPDLYAVPLFGGPIDMGPGNWSLMSSGGWGGDNHSPQYPTHMGAWPLQFLGWDRTFRPRRDSTVTLEPLESGGSIMQLWFEGEQDREHFLVENRQRLGFDRNLPGAGLIVYHLDDPGGAPVLHLLEADGQDDLFASRNRGDASDPFPGSGRNRTFDDDSRPSTHCFAGNPTNVALRSITEDGNRVRFFAQVRSRGWLPPRDITGPEFQPLDSYGFAQRSAVDEQGRGYVVNCETRSGHAQIVLRSGLGAWEEPFAVSVSSGAAIDPALAVIPGGDLAIVWSDDRSGRFQLFYRSRIRGVWTGERLLASLPGDCRYPAIGADSRGTISMAFQYFASGQAQIRFLRFTYYSPFGQSLAVTGGGNQPGSPAVVVDPSGPTFIIWTDRTTGPQRLWFCRYRADSGLSGNAVLTPPPTAAQLGFSATMDGQGTLHVVWQTSGPGINQIHYQRRPRMAAVGPDDLVLESRGYLLQRPVIAADGLNHLHVVFEAAPSTVPGIRYLRFDPAQGWDMASSEVTDPTEGGAYRPQPLPASDRELHIAYAQYLAEPRFRIRTRVTGGASLAAPLGVAKAVAGLVLRPNPIHLGQGFELTWEGRTGSRSPAVEFFDVAGRRLATVPLAQREGRWHGRVEGAVTREWARGIYFARVTAGHGQSARFAILR